MEQYSIELVWPCAAVDTRVRRHRDDSQRVLVASLSRWHMRWFLALAERQKYTVESYRDRPLGLLVTNGLRPQKLVRVTLQPRVRFLGIHQPSAAQVKAIHAAARAQCALGNGIEMEVCYPPERIEPVQVLGANPLRPWPWRQVVHMLRRGRPRHLAIL